MSHDDHRSRILDIHRQRITHWLCKTGLVSDRDWTHAYGDTLWNCWLCTCRHLITFEYPPGDEPTFYRERLYTEFAHENHPCPCHVLPTSIPGSTPTLIWAIEATETSNHENKPWLITIPVIPETNQLVSCRCGKEPVAWLLHEQKTSDSGEDLSYRTDDSEDLMFRWFCALCLNLPEDLDILAQAWIFNPEKPDSEPEYLQALRQHIETAQVLGWTPLLRI